MGTLDYMYMCTLLVGYYLAICYIYKSAAMQENLPCVYESHALSEWSTSYVVHAGKSISIASSREKLI